MSESYNLQVIGLGALNVDHIYWVTHTVEDGEALATSLGTFPGGSAANTIYGLARLGIGAGFIGIVGEDEAGRMLLESFREVDVDTGHIKITHHPSAQTLCFSDSLGRRSIYILPGANDQLSPEDIDLHYLQKAQLLHISSFVGSRQWELVRGIILGMPSWVIISFSPGALYASKGLEVLRPLLNRTTLLFTNYAELTQMTGADVPDGSQACLDAGCEVVIVTLGRGAKLSPEGGECACYVRSANEEYTVPRPELEPDARVESTGSGDAFASGFLYGFLKGRPLLECARLGVASAIFCLTQPGARSRLPDSAQLYNRYLSWYGKGL